ncbi:MAG: NADH-quinone oxidoreductase subunit K [Hyphomicrobiaceae bacterium]
MDGGGDGGESTMGPVTLHHFLIVSLVLFSAGLFCVLTRRNAIGILMGVELILNSANLNFIAFSRYGSGNFDGQVFSIFVIMLAAAEAAIGLAIVLGIYRKFHAIDVANMTTLRN